MDIFGLFLNKAVCVCGVWRDCYSSMWCRRFMYALISTHCFVGLHGAYERRRCSRRHEGKRQDRVRQHPSDLWLAQRVRQTLSCTMLSRAWAGLEEMFNSFCPVSCVALWRVWVKDRVLCCCGISRQGKSRVCHASLCQDARSLDRGRPLTVMTYH